MEANSDYQSDREHSPLFGGEYEVTSNLFQETIETNSLPNKPSPSITLSGLNDTSPAVLSSLPSTHLEESSLEPSVAPQSPIALTEATNHCPDVLRLCTGATTPPFLSCISESQKNEISRIIYDRNGDYDCKSTNMSSILINSTIDQKVSSDSEAHVSLGEPVLLNLNPRLESTGLSVSFPYLKDGKSRENYSSLWGSCPVCDQEEMERKAAGMEEFTHRIEPEMDALLDDLFDENSDFSTLFIPGHHILKCDRLNPIRQLENSESSNYAPLCFLRRWNYFCLSNYPAELYAYTNHIHDRLVSLRQRCRLPSPLFLNLHLNQSHVHIAGKPDPIKTVSSSPLPQSPHHDFIDTSTNMDVMQPAEVLPFIEETDCTYPESLLNGSSSATEPLCSENFLSNRSPETGDFRSQPSIPSFDVSSAKLVSGGTSSSEGPTEILQTETQISSERTPESSDCSVSGEDSVLRLDVNQIGPSLARDRQEVRCCVSKWKLIILFHM
ncbi:unnamed protein product [Protopolystoma xenopodis]|uniref:Uncharacterized protein n=1 Tax=Protopolystoma xenopodis TaxID=117903 RepID=A0A3S5AIR6_9PLAT|nr:unnamed protein product [Protopolystoma xenopodis]